jgi:diguanylate cyclase (GGDEF)-like protein/PAS domain S-box-containing protein
LFPPIVWVAFRFYPRVTLTASLLLTLIVIAGTISGIGPYATFGGGSGLVVAQAFASIVTMTVLVLSAATYERSVQEKALRESEGRFRALADSSPSMIWVADPSARWTFVNKTWLDFTRRALQELGTGWVESVHPDDLDGLVETYNTAFDAKRPFRADVRLRRADGQYRWVMMTGSPQHDPDGTFSGYVGTCMDISDRKRYEQELQLEAFRDPLTGLPNRALFLDRLQQCISAGQRRDALGFAVLFIDIDRLKFVNDTLGHAAGDRLIAETAKRIQAVLRPGDTVARLGGDEFAVLLEDVRDVHHAEAVARDIEAVIKKSIWLAGEEFAASASVGVAFACNDESNATAMLDEADAAMYRAKAMRRAARPTLDAAGRHVETLRIDAELRNAIEDGSLEVHFQPIVDVSTSEVSGFEALARWNHAERGLILPAEFISIAEQTGLIADLDRFVLRAACMHVGKWKREHPNAAPVTVSVNVSAGLFAHMDILEAVSDALFVAGIDGSCLELELTESALIQNWQGVADSLNRLRGMGVRIALDDFGTGYSSLGRLKQFPIDSIKIDRSFVGGLKPDGEGHEIVKAIVSLAHVLGLSVTAEGVETEGEFVAVRALGCELVQGYYFGRPVPISHAQELILPKPEKNGSTHTKSSARVSLNPSA